MVTPTYAAIQPCTSHLKRTITSGTVKVLRQLHAAELLALVEFLILHRQRVDVVQRVVAVDDVDRLPDLQADDARGVDAADLAEDNRILWRVERVTRVEAGFDVHERVLHALVGADQHRVALRIRTGVGHAVRIGRHLDRFGGGLSAVERDLAGDRAGGRRVDLLAGGGRRRRRRRRGSATAGAGAGEQPNQGNGRKKRE